MLRPKPNYTHLSDLELFSMVKSENVAAFEELYSRHRSDLINAVYKRLQSRQRAEDLVQDLFISIYQKRAVIEFTISVKAYLHQAIKYKVLNEFRSELIRTKYQKSLFFSDFCKNDFANRVEAKELGRKIEQTVDSLPEKCRQVFLMSRKDNLSNKDISNGLHISVSTVEKHIGKALNILRSNLGGEYPVYG